MRFLIKWEACNRPYANTIWYGWRHKLRMEWCDYGRVTHYIPLVRVGLTWHVIGKDCKPAVSLRNLVPLDNRHPLPLEEALRRINVSRNGTNVPSYLGGKKC